MAGNARPSSPDAEWPDGCCRRRTEAICGHRQKAPAFRPGRTPASVGAAGTDVRTGSARVPAARRAVSELGRVLGPAGLHCSATSTSPRCSRGSCRSCTTSSTLAPLRARSAEQRGQLARAGRRSAPCSRQVATGRGQAVPITRSSSSGSTLPPESTATTGGSKRPGSSSSAATPAAPAGSTTSLTRSSSMQQRPRDRLLGDRDDLVDQLADDARTARRPAQPTAMPSAIVAMARQRHRRPGAPATAGTRLHPSPARRSPGRPAAAP